MRDTEGQFSLAMREHEEQALQLFPPPLRQLVLSQHSSIFKQV